MDRLTSIKIKNQSGVYGNQIPISALVQNIEYDNNHNLLEVLGSIKTDESGNIQNIQSQLDFLYNNKASGNQVSGLIDLIENKVDKNRVDSLQNQVNTKADKNVVDSLQDQVSIKVSYDELNNYVDSQIPSHVTDWLNDHVNPVGSAIIVDDSLTIEGAAADSKKTGDNLRGKLYGGAYFDIMGQGTVESYRRIFYVDKNKVSSVSSGSTTQFKTINLFGTPTEVGNTWKAADLSNQTFYDLSYSGDDYDLRVNINWETNYEESRNSLCVATKNTATNVITKAVVSADSESSKKYRAMSLFDLLPEIKENGNFALFYENKVSNQANVLTYSLELIPADAIDDTLTIEGVAADAKKTGDEINSVKNNAEAKISNMLSGSFEPIPIQISSTGAVRYADGIVISSTQSSVTDYIIVKGLSIVKYKRQGSTGSSSVSGIAFYDKNKEYISGVQTALSQTTAGYLSDLWDAIVPNEAIYARFTTYTDTVVYGEFELYGISVFYERENEIANGVYSETTPVLASDFTSPCYIKPQYGSTGTDVHGRASLLNYYGGDERPMTAISVNLYGYCFRAFYYTGITQSTYKGFTDYVPCDGQIFILPKKHFQYARFTFYHDPIDNVDFTAEELANLANAITVYDFAKNANNSEEIQYIKRESTAMGLNTIPNSIGMLNVIRRARQHTDITWTPVANMKKAMLQGPNYTHPNESVITTNDQRRHDDLFIAGKEYSGIPYTEFGDGKYEYNSTLGNLDSFASAVQYANTMAYSDENYRKNSQRAARMGGTCVDIPLYAYEIPRGHLNTWGGRFSDNVEDVFGNDYSDFRPELLRQGDILHIESHTVMITDIISDATGTITAIEVSENSTTGNMTGEIGTNYGGKARRWAWPLTDFYNYFGRYGYSVYRMKQTMIDRVTYTPLSCVQIGTETKKCYDGPLPLIPENGNKCIIARGPKPYSSSLDDSITLLLEKTEAVADDADTTWNKIAVTDPDGNIQKYDISGNSLTLTTSANGIWSACPQVVDANDDVLYTGANTEWYVILLNSISYTFDGSGGFTLTVSHLDTDDCELVGFVMDATGGLVLEAIANYSCTSTVANGIRTWTVTGNGVSASNTKIWHIAMRTPFGLAKCVTDRVY